MQIKLKSLLKNQILKLQNSFSKIKNILGIAECLFFKASSIIKELSKFTPEIVENCKKCLKESKVDLDFLRLDKSSFSKCPDISIDISSF